MRRPASIVSCCLALALTGCGISDPYNDDDPRPAGSQQGSGGGETADVKQALEEFANTWANWSAGTLGENRRELASMASGEAREILLRDAREAKATQEAASADMSNSGRVEAVLPRANGRALVVTREVARFKGGGDQPSYLVYLARVEAEGDDWKVVEWQPTP